MIIKLLKNKEKGYVAFFITILILSIMLGIAFSIVILTLNAQKISANIIKSSQAYYAAEAGIEDGLLRFFDPDIAYSSSNTFSVAGATITTSINKISTSLIVESEGNSSNRIRKVRVEAHVSSTEANFYYGIQVGNGGLTMIGNSKVFGNIYSNGSVLGSGDANIYGDIYVAKSTGIIDNMNVIKAGADDGNAHAHTIFNSTIENGAYYQVIDGVTTADSFHPDSPDPESESLPISLAQIDNWEIDALDGGIISGDYLAEGDISLGPIKIDGNLTIDIDGDSVFIQTGTIWVTGDLIVTSGTAIELDDGYGSSSGVIVVEGKIILNSNVVICGSEGYKSVGNTCYDNEGSFLMFLSTYPYGGPLDPAIFANSNTNAAILYANNGLIRLGASTRLKEVTGYALYFNSNATVTYESGLANVNFTSGPAGGWEIISWQEIE